MENYSFTNFTSEEIVWNGPNISCIDLCTGQIVSDVVYKIGKRLCEIITDFEELETIDLSCIIDKCDNNICFEDHSLINLFRILLNNDCSLKQLLDEVTDAIIDKTNLNLKLDLSCLTKCPVYNSSLYNFLCATKGIAGDKIQVKYYLANNTSVIYTTILNKGECLQYNLPSEKIFIVEKTIITGTTIDVEIKDSIGFSSCPDCTVCNCDCGDDNCDEYNSKTNCESILATVVDFTTFPGHFKPKDFSLNDLLQFLIYRICCQEGNLIEIDNKLGCLEQEYADIIAEFIKQGVYIEPNLSLCINNVTSSHSIATLRLSDYLCSLRNNIGTTQEIQNSILKACNASWISIDYPQMLCSPLSAHSVIVEFVYIDGITYPINVNIGFGQLSLAVTALNNNLPSSLARFSENGNQLQYNNIASYIFIGMKGCDGVTPFNITFASSYVNAVNLAQDSENQWTVLCNILERVSSQENSNCCLPDCKEVKIGFKSIYSDSDGIHKIIFNTSYGTVIPELWSDNGSIITATDVNGVKIIFNITITEDSEFELNLEGMDLTKVVNIAIRTNFIHENGLICKNLYVDTLPIVYTPCSFCRLCAFGSVETDLLKVLYFTSDNPTVRSQTLSSGSCITFKLPLEFPTIVDTYTITPNSDIILSTDPSSDCSEDIVIPEPKSNTCWFFPIPISETFNIKVDDVNGITVPVVHVDFDFYATSTNTFKYKSISINGANVLLTGDTLATAITKGAALNPSFDSVTISVKAPISTEIVSSTSCSSTLAKFGGVMDADGIISIFFVGFNINKKVSFVYEPGANPLGIILELHGQDSLSTPELILTDPITGTDMIIRGIYQEDTCECS